VGLGRGGELAGVAVGADGSRRVFVVGVGGIVDVIGVAVFGDGEVFGAAIDDGVVVGEGDLHAQAIEAVVEPGENGRVRNPGEIAVVERVGSDVEEERGALRRILVEIDVDRVFAGVVVRIPADGA